MTAGLNVDVGRDGADPAIESSTKRAIFTYTTTALVLLMYINLGTVLDLKRLKAILYHVVGPLIGFCCRYISMPALAILLGWLCFRHDKWLQLAILVTALAPSGGLANISIIFLKGNINLSIATTTINSLLALGMFPLWLYVLLQARYMDATFSMPIWNLLAAFLILVLAISLGVVLRIFIPHTTRLIFKFLKPLSVLLSLCLIALTVVINAHAFKQLTGMVFLAAILLPTVGYGLSFGLAKLCCRSSTDALTIGLESSVLNMTMPIVVLQFSLEEATADLVVIVPIMSALLSLLMVAVLYIVRRIFGWNVKSDEDAFDGKQLLAQI